MSRSVGKLKGFFQTNRMEQYMSMNIVIECGNIGDLCDGPFTIIMYVVRTKGTLKVQNF